MYLKYCRALKFEDKPDYCWVKRLFKDLYFRMEKEWDSQFDWTLLVKRHPLNSFFILTKKILSLDHGLMFKGFELE
jgi:hypothetical protein